MVQDGAGEGRVVWVVAAARSAGVVVPVSSLVRSPRNREVSEYPRKGKTFPFG